MVKWGIQKLQSNLKWGMHLKYTMHKLNICIIWYIECNNIFDKIGMRNIHGNVFSDTVFLKHTLIEIKGKFP